MHRFIFFMQIYHLIRTKADGINLVHRIAHGWCTNSNTRTQIPLIKLSPTQQSTYSMGTVYLWQRHQPIWQAQGTLIFNPRSAQSTPVTCHFRLLKLAASLLPGQDWGRYPYKVANGKLPTGIPNGTLGTHTHTPGPFEAGWDGQSTAVSSHSTAASASTVSRGCRQALEFLKATRPPLMLHLLTPCALAMSCIRAQAHTSLTAKQDLQPNHPSPPPNFLSPSLLLWRHPLKQTCPLSK